LKNDFRGFPRPWGGKEFHSNYFQALGEHGWPGLALYLLLLLLTWRLGSNIIKLCRGRPELYWARDLAVMLQAALVAYAVGGITITHAFWEPFYLFIALLTVTRSLVRKELESRSPRVQPYAAPAPLAAGANPAVAYGAPSVAGAAGRDGAV